MYQENELDKLEQICGVADGLNCLAHMLEIVDNSAEQISLKDFAEVLLALSFKTNTQSRQTVELLHNKTA